METIYINQSDPTKVGFFTLGEFHPNSNHRMKDDDVPNFHLPEVLLVAGNLIREAIGAPVYVNSSMRSKGKNQSVGGVSNSLHLPYEEGGKLMTRAVDFGISAGIKDLHGALLNNAPLAQELRSMGIGGIGLYDTFIHLDVGDVRMWDNRVSTKVGKFNPTIIYHNIVQLLKKKDAEEEEDISDDMAEGFFRNPWFAIVVCGFIYFKFIKS